LVKVIANAHLTLEEEYYVCSVCSMKFKQPGNARRHIITVHRNEKPHICLKCDARFGRKVRQFSEFFFLFFSFFPLYNRNAFIPEQKSRDGIPLFLGVHCKC
jgi:hypothetical protein